MVPPPPQPPAGIPPEEPPPDIPPGEPPERARRRSFAGLVVEDIRSVRRWLALLGALAVIATGIAIFALLKGGESADEGRVTQLERRLADAQRQLRRASEESDVNKIERGQRMKAEETDIRRVGTQLGRVDRRLRRVEGDVVDAVDTTASTGRGIASLDDRLNRLSTRVDDIEDRQPGGR